MIVGILSLICSLAVVGARLRVYNDPGQAPAICAAHGSNSILIAHEDCSKFYKCSRGIPVPMKCPKSLLYNPEKAWCDWPGNVNCKREINKEWDGHDTESSRYVDIVKKICSVNGSHGLLLPHEVCSKFCMCSYGKIFVYDCLRPMLYNIENKVCDWPQNVDCKNRLHNDPTNEIL